MVNQKIEHLIFNDRVKIKGLIELEKRISLTPSALSRILKCQYETIKNALNFLEIIGLVSREVRKRGKKNYEYYSLTLLGKEIVKKMEELNK